MASFSALSTGARAALLAGGAAIAAAVFYGIWSANQPSQPASAPEVAEQPTPAAPDTSVAAQPAAKAEPATGAAALPETVATPQPAPEATEEPAPEQAAETAATPVPADPAAPAVEPPTFDVVRVEPNGSTIVAGRAAPGAKIVMRVDGSEISATTADADGNFAGFFVLDSSAKPRMLTMSMLLPGQTEVPAAAAVALAPTEAPVAVARAEPAAPEAAPQATETATAEPEATEPATTAPTAEEPIAEAAVPQAPTALLITKDGVNVLQQGDPAAASGASADLVIDTISYTAAGEVQLAGRGTAGAFVRIYLDNAVLTDLPVGEDGRWASTMPEIAPGVYILRADQLAEDGTVTARFETPFKRETKEALAAAAQAPEPMTEVATAEPAAEPSGQDETLAQPEEEPATVAKPAQPAAPAASDTNPQVAEPAAAAPAPAAVSVTVQPGFTLWGIASAQFGDGVLYVQVYEANKDKIRDPDLIYPGQVFVIPSKSE
jgi:outer membrane biosynthesis protein TonB